MKVLNKVPVEINKHVLSGMQTSSVSKFNNYFDQLETSLEQIPNCNLTQHKIPDMADSHYREMMQTGEWTSVRFNNSNNFLMDDSKDAPCKRYGKFHLGKSCGKLYW